MVKKMTLLVVCCALSLFASEKKPKDIYTVNDLNREITRAREEYKKNKHDIWNDYVTKGHRINHQPVTHLNVLSDQQKDKC